MLIHNKAWSKRFIPKLFVWHSSRDIVRMKWRYNWTGLYTEKKRSHWLNQWPIRKGLGDQKRQVVIGWKCNLNFVDDTFAIFNNEDDCNAFLSHFNSLHPSLCFTHEKVSNHSLPFLMCWLKDVTRNFQHQSTGNLPPLAGIYAGIPLAPTNGKSI